LKIKKFSNSRIPIQKIGHVGVLPREHLHKIIEKPNNSFKSLFSKDFKI
jgi:hypothetical protein